MRLAGITGSQACEASGELELAATFAVTQEVFETSFQSVSSEALFIFRAVLQEEMGAMGICFNDQIKNLVEALTFALAELTQTMLKSKSGHLSLIHRISRALSEQSEDVIFRNRNY